MIGSVEQLARRSFLSCAGAAAAALAMPAFAGRGPRAAEATRIVSTSAGKLRGSIDGQVAVFKGVRYAGPTGGPNRFLPPTPATPWTGVHEATVFGHSAPQKNRAYGNPMAQAISDWYSALQLVSEDCLFLNVYAPVAESRRGRPVMVWLHGGGWSTSSGTPPGTDGARLAGRGDVVVVTINHRLGVFGYLDLGEGDERFSDAGNTGMLDMVAALRWVRDNIAAFGGDPSNVTIFGQSGGAAKVAALMGLPAAAGLFHKAIAESCSGGLRVMPREQAARLAQALAVKLQLPRADGAALQGVPMEALVSAAYAMADPFRPVLDGRSFTVNPYDETPSPLSPAVPLLIGNAATEATQFLAADKRNRDITLAAASAKLARFWHVDANEAARIVDAFRQSMAADTTPFHVYAQIVTDYMYRRNTMHIADLKATQAAPVHAYLFAWQTPVFGGILLSPHTVEVPFVFGTTREAAGLLGEGPDLDYMSEIMMESWSAFAHRGDPNTALLPSWPTYRGEEKATMIFDDRSVVRSDPDGERRKLFDSLPYFEYGALQYLLRG